MKANELRIGNYYQDELGNVKVVTSNTIEAVWDAQRSWCKPIQLTEEWLEKLGFLKRDDGIYSIQYEDCFEDIQVFQLKKFQYKYNGFEYRSIYSSDFHGKIEHVHDLQNKFNSASGEELTPTIK